MQPSPAEDYIYNYHRGKLAYGLVFLEFNNAIKEGDGERIFDIYKMALLLYKVGGHYKYAYVVLLYLVKIAAVLPASSAHNLKWNRFCNKHGGKGKNISLDLQMEQLNCLKHYGEFWEQIYLKAMHKGWLALWNHWKW